MSKADHSMDTTTDPNSDTPPVSLLLRDGRPDWGQIGFDVFCSRCGYNLYTLRSPKCPECGLDFNWSDVLNKAGWESDFLFEHHWRSRPLRSWLATVFRGMRPVRFWRTVSIHERINARPLFFLFFTAPLVFLGALRFGSIILSTCMPLIRNMLEDWDSNYSNDLLWRLYSVLYWLVGGRWSDSSDWAWAAGGLTSLHLVSLATLCALRQTAARFNVRTVQFLRIGAYAIQPAILIAILIFWVTANLWYTFRGRTTTITDFDYLFGLLAIVALIEGVYYAAGLRYYLRLPHAFVVGVSASAVGFLVVSTTFMLVAVWSLGGWS